MPTFQEIESIGALISKYLNTELSEAEESALQQWINASTANKAMFDSLTNTDQLLQQLLELEDDGDSKNVVWQSIQRKRRSQQEESVFTLFRRFG